MENMHHSTTQKTSIHSHVKEQPESHSFETHSQDSLHEKSDIWDWGLRVRAKRFLEGNTCSLIWNRKNIWLLTNIRNVGEEKEKYSNSRTCIINSAFTFSYITPHSLYR